MRSKVRGFYDTVHAYHRDQWTPRPAAGMSWCSRRRMRWGSWPGPRNGPSRRTGLTTARRGPRSRRPCRSRSSRHTCPPQTCSSTVRWLSWRRGGLRARGNTTRLPADLWPVQRIKFKKYKEVWKFTDWRVLTKWSKNQGKKKSYSWPHFMYSIGQKR